MSTQSSALSAPMAGQGEPPASPEFETLQAIVAFLSRSIGPELMEAAARLSPLSPPTVEGLEQALTVRLDSIRTSLQARHDAAMREIEADRARWARIDVPEAMRSSVKRQRGISRKVSP